MWIDGGKQERGWVRNYSKDVMSVRIYSIRVAWLPFPTCPYSDTAYDVWFEVWRNRMYAVVEILREKSMQGDYTSKERVSRQDILVNVSDVSLLKFLPRLSSNPCYLESNTMCWTMDTSAVDCHRVKIFQSNVLNNPLRKYACTNIDWVKGRMGVMAT